MWEIEGYDGGLAMGGEDDRVGQGGSHFKETNGEIELAEELLYKIN